MLNSNEEKEIEKEEEEEVNSPDGCNEFVESYLFANKVVFLSGEIDIKKTEYINKSLLALDTWSENEKKEKYYEPIKLIINSAGGEALSGFSIIDTIQSLRSPVITIISGQACSMAALISVAASGRAARRSSFWMMHPLSAGNQDYYPFLKDRADFTKKIHSLMPKILKKYTKLNKKDMEKIEHGELWLDSREMLIRGVIDNIV